MQAGDYEAWPQCGAQISKEEKNQVELAYGAQTAHRKKQTERPSKIGNCEHVLERVEKRSDSFNHDSGVFITPSPKQEVIDLTAEEDWAAFPLTQLSERETCHAIYHLSCAKLLSSKAWIVGMWDMCDRNWFPVFGTMTA